jgi:hypothetical protein
LRSAALASLAGLLLLFAGCGSDNQPYNDTPAITSIFPSSAAAGGPGFTLNVAGTGFISTSVVYWNNSARTTTFNATSTQLSISVTAQDIATPGTAQVVVVSPAPGGGPSPAVNFTITPQQNPVPTITSLSVALLPAGNILTVNGTNFVPNSAVNFNGIARPTNFGSATQLTVNASDVASNATITVTVSNPAPGGGVSNAVSFKVGTGGSVRLKAGVAASDPLPHVVSVSAAGGPANGASTVPAVSSDGRFVAFYSAATDLVSQGPSGNIFVRDTCLGAANCSPQTVAVDLAPDGTAPNATADTRIAISGDGRFVAFSSLASNLLPGPSGAAPSQSNVYVRDLCEGLDAPAECVPHTELVSARAAGAGSEGASDSPSLSLDGRFVAFVSTATDLVAASGAGRSGVYVRDTCAGVTAPVSCVPSTYSASSIAATGLSAPAFTNPVISADGRYVAFDASNGQVYLADTCLGPNAPAACVRSARQISISADGSPLPGVSGPASISADARFVAFESDAGDAAPSVLLRDTCNGSAGGCNPSTVVLMQNAAAPYLSPDGRYVSLVANPWPVSQAGGSPAGLLYVYDTCLGALAACAPQAYPVAVPGLASASSPFSVSGASPLSSGGAVAVISTSAIFSGLPSSGYGDIVLTATPF